VADLDKLLNELAKKYKDDKKIGVSQAVDELKKKLATQKPSAVSYSLLMFTVSLQPESLIKPEPNARNCKIATFPSRQIGRSPGRSYNMQRPNLGGK